MANRNWASGGKIYSMHVKPVIINATAQIGAAGAVSSYVGSAVSAVTKSATGIYKVKCQSQTNFSKLFFAQGSMQSPAIGLSGIATIEIQNAPDASVAISGGAELTVKCLDAAGALADPASGSALNIMMMCSDSSVIIDGE
jgi:hypothetical protein